MGIDKRKVGGVQVLRLNDRLTAEEGIEEFLQEITDLLDQGETQVLLDLEGVEFIDSMGIDSLVTSYTRAKKRGGEVKFCSPPDRVRRLLEMTRLVSVFDVRPDQVAALAAFSADHVD